MRNCTSFAANAPYHLYPPRSINNACCVAWERGSLCASCKGHICKARMWNMYHLFWKMQHQEHISFEHHGSSKSFLYPAPLYTLETNGWNSLPNSKLGWYQNGSKTHEIFPTLFFWFCNNVSGLGSWFQEPVRIGSDQFRTGSGSGPNPTLIQKIKEAIENILIFYYR